MVLTSGPRPRSRQARRFASPRCPRLWGFDRSEDEMGNCQRFRSPEPGHYRAPFRSGRHACRPDRVVDRGRSAQRYRSQIRSPATPSSGLLPTRSSAWLSCSHGTASSSTATVRNAQSCLTPRPQVETPWPMPDASPVTYAIAATHTQIDKGLTFGQRQEWESTVHACRAHGTGGLQIGAVELGEVGDPQQTEAFQHLGLQQF